MNSNLPLQLMVDALPIGACVFSGPEHTIIAANDPMLNIWGKKRTVIGMHLLNALPEIKNQGFDALLTAIYTTGESYHNPNGTAIVEVEGQPEQRYFDFSFKPLRNEQGVIYGIVNIAVDRTRPVLERLQEDQRKEAFMGTVSHELKSPLTSLNGFLQILNLKTRNLKDDTIFALIGKARKQSDKILAIITGFLDVARIGEKKIKLNTKVFDMAHLIKDAEQDQLARITTHQIIYHPVEYTPVNADQDKIEQVLINFINNAVKYSPEGSSINVACITENNQAFVSVSDEGMGIAEKDLPHIFERFYRVESEAMEMINGFGIGLYICKEIIEQHGGKIGTDSKLGKGSKFWFKLPVNL